VSEATIASGIQTILQGMSEFSSADVSINDWGILDGERNQAPFAIIVTADDFTATFQTNTGNRSWAIPVLLFEDWVDWDTTLVAFKTTRQAIIDKFNTSGGNQVSAGGLEATQITAMRSNSPIEPYFLPYNAANLTGESQPDYLVQEIVFDVDEGWG
jgi:hypothetical protein